MTRITLLLLACIGFVAWVEEPPGMTDGDGHVWIIGSGDDCHAAWRKAVWPDGVTEWREIECVKPRP